MVDHYKDTCFDIYHVGYPYVREAIMLGKRRSNVWLNMCWTYIISEQFAYEALSEMLDMVPTNKIIGFGGDYIVVEKVFGHLTIARQTIARVLCARVRRGLLTMDRAFDLADKLLRRNPSSLYNL
jgi:predicted TIM-barrel fold metal-dependent hydrolase